MNYETKNQKPLPWIYFCGRGFVVFTHRITRRYPMSKNILRYLLLFHKFTKTNSGCSINDIINSGRQR